MRNIVITLGLFCAFAVQSCTGQERPVNTPTSVLHTIDQMETAAAVINSHAGEEMGSVLQPKYSSFTTVSHKYLLSQVPASATDQQTAIYPRIKKLNDGRYMMLYHGGQLGTRCFMTFSSDLKKWSEPYMFFGPETVDVNNAEDTRRYVNPDAVVMPDGEIIVVVSFRDTKAYSKNIGGGLKIIRSKDNGKSWSQPELIYEGTNWEPYLLLLPDGKLHCYFTDCTPMTKNSGTSVMVSSDRGKTWTEKIRCCRIYKYEYDGPNTQFTGEKIYTDQMPCFRVLNDGKTIFGFLEDRIEVPASIQGSSIYEMSLVYSDGLQWQDLGEQSAGPARRASRVLRGCAGYVSTFPSGEVILSSNIDKVFSLKIGDATATRFQGANWNEGWLKPFDGIGFWGSTEVIGTHEIVGAMHDTDTGIQIGRFRLNHRINSSSKKIVFDGETDEWDFNEALYISSTGGIEKVIRSTHNADTLFLAVDGLSAGGKNGNLTLSLAVEGKNSVCKVSVAEDGTVTSDKDGVKGISLPAATESGRAGFVTEIAVPFSELSDSMPEYVRINATVKSGNSVMSFTFASESDPTTWQKIAIR